MRLRWYQKQNSASLAQVYVVNTCFYCSPPCHLFFIETEETSEAAAAPTQARATSKATPKATARPAKASTAPQSTGIDCFEHRFVSDQLLRCCNHRFGGPRRLAGNSRPCACPRQRKGQENHASTKQACFVGILSGMTNPVNCFLCFALCVSITLTFHAAYIDSNFQY
jgi:hypothetical protein